MSQDFDEKRVPLPQVGVRGPGPGVLADLFSLAGDIDFARQCAEAYVARPENAPGAEQTLEPGPVPHALWNASAISYRRAFNSGRAHLVDRTSRLRLADVVHQILTSEQLTVHEAVLRMANQHVAHRVSDLEGAVVTVFLAPPPQEREILGIGNLGAHFVGPEVDFVNDFICICTLVREALQSEIDRRSDRLITTLRETADIDSLYQQAGVGPSLNSE